MVMQRLGLKLRSKGCAHFDALDASIEHKGVILTMDIDNQCRNELENFLLAEEEATDASPLRVVAMARPSRGNSNYRFH